MRRLSTRATIAAAAGLSLLAAADFLPPAGERYARVTAKASILPGGRVIQPLGIVLETGPGPSALSVSPKGIIATADMGPERLGITILVPGKNVWESHHLWARSPFNKGPERAEPGWDGVSSGIVFETEKAVWVSEGATGRVRLVDVNSGDHIRIVDLNQGEWRGSFTADLALVQARRLLVVCDRVNPRLALIDTRKGQVISTVNLNGIPTGLALSPDGQTAYAASASKSEIAIVDIRDSLKPSVTDTLRTAFAPGAMVARADRIFVANPQDDSIVVLSSAVPRTTVEIRVAIPGLAGLRGVVPSGMAFDAVTGWLLVAETGINAVAVIDTRTNALIAHIPAGWSPILVAISGDRVCVVNTYGRGTGPNLRRPLLNWGEPGYLDGGSVSTFIMPAASELPKLTGLVYAAGGLVPQATGAAAIPPLIPPAIRYVALIAKRGGTFDEVLGDIAQPNMRVAAMPQLARFGMHGLADGNRVRFSIHDVPVTPNQHGIALRWAFADNFYGDDEATFGMWEANAPLWNHLRKNQTSYVRLGERHDTPVSGQLHATRFIEELRRRYGSGDEPLPRFLFFKLTNDAGMPAEDPPGSYPYAASYVADDDLAIGRIVEYLSGTPWWNRMAVFIASPGADGGLDHVDSHRTTLLAAGPWVRRGYVAHVNADHSSLMKTILAILNLPPLGLADATASSLAGVFTTERDDSPWHAEQPDKRIFQPAP